MGAAGADGTMGPDGVIEVGIRCNGILGHDVGAEE